jgi:23S rRNA pseudouridine1911/1915/1917 synthase
MARKPTHPPAPANDDSSEDVVRSAHLLLPSGRVDPDAIILAAREIAERRATAGEDAEESGESELPSVTFEIRKDINKRVDKYLTDRITFMSRNQLQKLIDNGGVWVNDKIPKSSTLLHAGDMVEVIVPPPPSKDIQPEDIPLDVLFEDDHLIVLNKQPDIIVHPARSHLKGTMLSALAFHFLHRSPRGGTLSSVGKDLARPGVIHRLDRHTSGCIVFAKTEEAHWKMGHHFEHRRVDKRYLAIVQGRVEPDTDVITLPIGPHPSREKGYREKYVVRHDELGKASVTVCRVRERYAIAEGTTSREGASYSLVELELKTGRTHQIRVHLSHSEWPIVGDDMYGGKPYLDAAGETLIAHPALHACLLGFQHPITGEPMVFTAPLRGEIARLVADLRIRSGGGERLDTPGATVDLDKALSRLEAP